MGKIINVIEQVINSESIWVVAIGLLLIVCGIAVGVFKQTWLLSGSSHLTFMDDDAVDYIAIFMGFFIGILGAIIFFSVFVCTYFDVLDYFYNNVFLYLMLFALILAFLCFIVIVMKKEKNKKNEKL